MKNKEKEKSGSVQDPSFFYPAPEKNEPIFTCTTKFLIFALTVSQYFRLFHLVAPFDLSEHPP
jgi:hypothetical protein